MQSPFEKFPAEYVRMSCLKCGEQIYNGTFPVIWPESHKDNWRLDSVISHKVAQHKCPASITLLAEAKEGMRIIRRNNPGMTFDEECEAYNEIMANQTYPDEIEFRPAKQPPTHANKDKMPSYEIGRHVINIDSGHVWKIETQTDLETVVGGWVNGQRNIEIYI